MASVVRITAGEPEQRISIALDQEVYTMRFRWNSSDDARKGAWYVDVWEADGVTPIAFGIKLVLGAKLGNRYNHQLFVGGMFMAERGAPTGVEAGFFDIGTRVILVHFTIADRILAGMEIPTT